jgi:hypothetical protein
MRWRVMAFFRVRTTWSCPTTSSNVCGRHLRAMTWYELDIKRRSLPARAAAAELAGKPTQHQPPNRLQASSYIGHRTALLFTSENGAY